MQISDNGFYIAAILSIFIMVIVIAATIDVTLYNCFVFEYVTYPCSCMFDKCFDMYYDISSYEEEESIDDNAELIEK